MHNAANASQKRRLSGHLPLKHLREKRGNLKSPPYLRGEQPRHKGERLDTRFEDIGLRELGLQAYELKG